jgi:hypothetical protein
MSMRAEGIMSRRVIWPGYLWLISGNHLSREIDLRVRVDDTIPVHGGRTVIVRMNEREARLAIRQLTSLVEGLAKRPEDRV